MGINDLCTSFALEVVSESAHLRIPIDCNLRASAAERIAEVVPRNPHIRVVSLEGNMIGRCGVAAVGAALAVCRNLEQLNLDSKDVIKLVAHRSAAFGSRDCLNSCRRNPFQ